MKNSNIIFLFAFILTGLTIFPALSQTPDTTAADSAAVAPDSVTPQIPSAAPPDSVQKTPADSAQPRVNTSAAQNSDTMSADTNDLKVAADTAKADSPAATTAALPETITSGSDISASATGSTTNTLPDTTPPQIQETDTPLPVPEPLSSRNEPEESSQNLSTTDSTQLPDTAETDSLPSQTARAQPANDNGFGGWVFGIIGLIILVAAAAFILYRRSYKGESYAEEIIAEFPPPGPPAPINVKPASDIKLPAGQLIISPAQHPGSRKEQQDAFTFSDPKSALTHRGMLAVLADGMSGHAWGREASRTAVRAFREAYEEKAEEETIARALKRALTTASEAVIAFARERRAENNAGTTLTAALIDNANLHWIAVGDTRLYLLRNGHLQCLTVDHIYFNKLMEAVSGGKMKKADAEKHPDRDSLYSFLGLKRLPDISLNKEPHPLKTGDRLLLCSEGVYKTLSMGEISEVLNGNPKSIGESLVKRVLAKENPEQENITAIAIVFE
jgi:protein phosphatase